MEKEGKTVYIVQHVHEFDEWNEDIKLFGAFSSRETAQEAINQLSKVEGFGDIPEGFSIDKYELDKVHWQEGFATYRIPMFPRYIAIFHSRLTVDQTGYEQWNEEFHIISGVSIEEARAKAQARADAQATQYQNEAGQVVKVWPAKVISVEPFLTDGEDGPIAQRELVK